MQNLTLAFAIGLAAVLATSALSAGQDRPISGTVRDPEGKAIGKITLILASTKPENGSDNKPRRITVNDDGSFTGRVPEGDYRIIGTSPSCFAAHDLTLEEGGNLRLVLEWQSKSRQGVNGETGGTTATFNMGFSAGPTTVNLFRVGNPAGIGVTTQGIGAGVGITVNRTPNGGGIAVDSALECEKWMSKPR